MCLGCLLPQCEIICVYYKLELISVLKCGVLQSHMLADLSSLSNACKALA